MLIDKEKNSIVVSLYNFVNNSIKFGDMLTINEPQVEEISVTIRNQEFKYLCIPVHYPKLLINNNPPSRNAFIETSVVLKGVQ